MATKVYSSGLFIVIEQNSLKHNINKSNFDFSFNSGQVVLLDNSNSTSITDVFASIQDSAGTPIGGTLELIETYILSLGQQEIASTAATAAKQDSQIALETQIKDAIALLAKLTDTQPVSAASLPLPTGAATEATITTIKNDIAQIKADTQTSMGYLLKKSWGLIVGNSIVMSYYSGVVAGENPSGAANLEKAEYKTGVETIFTVTFTYDANNAVLTQTTT